MADLDLRSQATFEIVSREDGSFAVIVQVPESPPATVTPFAPSVDADHWIERYKRSVAEGHSRKNWKSRQDGNAGRTQQ